MSRTDDPPFYHGTKADLKPGNPTKSYRTRELLRVTGKILDWQGPPPAN